MASKETEKAETESTTSRAPTPINLELERRAVRKLDFTILPVMAMFYFLSFLVRYTPTFRMSNEPHLE